MNVDLKVSDVMRKRIVDGLELPIVSDEEGLPYIMFDHLRLCIDYKPEEETEIKVAVEFFHGDMKIVTASYPEMVILGESEVKCDFDGFFGRIPVTIEEVTDEETE